VGIPKDYGQAPYVGQVPPKNEFKGQQWRIEPTDGEGERTASDKQGITVIVNNANVAQSQSMSESASKSASASSAVPSNPPADKEVFIVTYYTGAKLKVRNEDEVTASSPDEAKEIVRQRVKGKIRIQSVTPKSPSSTTP
jgi:hypothetical protein